MSPPSTQEATALLRSLTRTLTLVAAMAGVFTAINTTLFAVAHDTPWPIAILLDPMTALALGAVLLADARLASWGIRPPAWSTVLRWFTGTAATLMNTWTSLWPDGHIGWPHHADVAGVVLHTVPPVLLALLAETVAAYRHRIAQLHSTHPANASVTGPPQPLPAPCTGTSTPTGGSGSTLPPGAPPLPTPTATAPDPTVPSHAQTALNPQAEPANAAADDVFAHALRLDVQHRSRTGSPMSIRQLKTALHIGHARGKQLRAQLDTHHATTALRERPENRSRPLLHEEHQLRDRF